MKPVKKLLINKLENKKNKNYNVTPNVYQLIFKVQKNTFHGEILRYLGHFKMD